MCKMSLQSTVGAGDDPVCPGTVISRRRGRKSVVPQICSSGGSKAAVPVEIGSQEFQYSAGDRVLVIQARATSQSREEGDRSLFDYDDNQGLHTIGSR